MYTSAMPVEMYHILYNTCVTFSVVIRFPKKTTKTLTSLWVKINFIINLITERYYVVYGGFSNQNVIAIRF